MQHARFGRLRINKEKDRAGEIQPGIGDHFRFIEQRADVAIHRVREWPVVVVIGELFGAAPEVTDIIAIFIFTAGPGLPLPGVRVTFAVIAALLSFGPAHFAQIDQRLPPLRLLAPALVTAGLLREVREHSRERFPADGVSVASVTIAAAHRREFADGFQKVGVGIFRRAQRKEKLPVLGGENVFDAFDVVRVRGAPRRYLFDLRVIQRADSAFYRLHQWKVRQLLLFFSQVAGVKGIRRAAAEQRRGQGLRACEKPSGANRRDFCNFHSGVPVWLWFTCECRKGARRGISR
ncbi:hypothetical protein BN136_330 [Cronobacter universalis NCTC 9529]|nr:hypothetical protein BN136_330 [Cronobacter universalis NCTC 9529]